MSGTAAGEWYPRECKFCDWGSALACTDSECRGRRFGEHRDRCASLADSVRGCDCLLTEVEAQ